MPPKKDDKGQELLKWCQKVTQGYNGVAVGNFSKSWKDGLAFCAIIHHFRPDLLDFSKLSASEPEKNAKLAFDIAEHTLGITQYLEVDDLKLSSPEPKSIQMQLFQWFKYFSSSRSATLKPNMSVEDEVAQLLGLTTAKPSTPSQTSTPVTPVTQPTQTTPVTPNNTPVSATVSPTKTFGTPTQTTPQTPTFSSPINVKVTAPSRTDFVKEWAAKAFSRRDAEANGTTTTTTPQSPPKTVQPEPQKIVVQPEPQKIIVQPEPQKIIVQPEPQKIMVQPPTIAPRKPTVVLSEKQPVVDNTKELLELQNKIKELTSANDALNKQVDEAKLALKQEQEKKAVVPAPVEKVVEKTVVVDNSKDVLALENKIKELNNTNDSLAKKIEQANQSLQKEQDNAKKAQQERDESRKQVEQFKKTISEREDKIKKIDLDNKQDSTKIKDLEKQLSLLQEEKIKLQSNFDKEYNEQQKRIEQLSKEQMSITQVPDLSGQVTSLENAKEKLEQENKKLVQMHEEEKSQWNDNLSHSKKQTKELEDELKSMQLKIKEQQNENLQNVEQVKKQLKQEQDLVKKINEDHIKERDDWNRKMKTITEKDSDEKLKQLVSERTIWEKSRKELENSIQSEKDERTKDVDSLNGKMNELQQTISKLTTDKQDLEKKQRGGNDERDRLERQITELKHKLEQSTIAQNKVTQLQEENGDLNEKCKSLLQQVNSLIIDQEYSKKEVERLTDKLKSDLFHKEVEALANVEEDMVDKNEIVVKQLEGEKKDLERQIEKLNRNNQSTIEKWNVTKQEVETLRSQLDNNGQQESGEVSKLQGQLIAANRQRAELKGQLDESIDAKSELESTVTDLRKQVEELQVQASRVVEVAPTPVVVASTSQTSAQEQLERFVIDQSIILAQPLYVSPVKSSPIVNVKTQKSHKYKHNSTIKASDKGTTIAYVPASLKTLYNSLHEWTAATRSDRFAKNVISAIQYSIERDRQDVTVQCYWTNVMYRLLHLVKGNAADQWSFACNAETVKKIMENEFGEEIDLKAVIHAAEEPIVLPPDYLSQGTNSDEWQIEFVTSLCQLLKTCYFNLIRSILKQIEPLLQDAIFGSTKQHVHKKATEDEMQIILDVLEFNIIQMRTDDFMHPRIVLHLYNNIARYLDTMLFNLSMLQRQRTNAQLKDISNQGIQMKMGLSFLESFFYENQLVDGEKVQELFYLTRECADVCVLAQPSLASNSDMDREMREIVCPHLQVEQIHHVLLGKQNAVITHLYEKHMLSFMEFLEPLSFTTIEKNVYQYEEINDINSTMFPMLPLLPVFTSDVIGDKRKEFGFLKNGLIEYKQSSTKVQQAPKKVSVMDDIDRQVSTEDAMFDKVEKVVQKPQVQQPAPTPVVQQQPAPVQPQKPQIRPLGVATPPSPKPTPTPVAQQPTPQVKQPEPIEPAPVPQKPVVTPVVAPVTAPQRPKGLFDDDESSDDIIKQLKSAPTPEKKVVSPEKVEAPVQEKVTPKKDPMFDDDPFAQTAKKPSTTSSLMDDPFMFDKKPTPKKSDLGDLENLLSAKPKGRGLFDDIDDMF